MPSFLLGHLPLALLTFSFLGLLISLFPCLTSSVPFVLAITQIASLGGPSHAVQGHFLKEVSLVFQSRLKFPIVLSHSILVLVIVYYNLKPVFM